MDPASAPDYFGQALNDDTLELIYVHRAVSNCDSEYANKLLENRIDGIRPCCRCLNCMGGPCRVNPTSAMGFIEAMPEGFEVPACDGSKEGHGYRRRPCWHGGCSRVRRVRLRCVAVREKRAGRPARLRRNGEGQARKPEPLEELPVACARGRGRERGNWQRGRRGLRARRKARCRYRVHGLQASRACRFGQQRHPGYRRDRFPVCRNRQ